MAGAQASQHFMQKSISTIINPACSMPAYTFINELHYQQTGTFLNKLISTRY